MGRANHGLTQTLPNGIPIAPASLAVRGHPFLSPVSDLPSSLCWERVRRSKQSCRGGVRIVAEIRWFLQQNKQKIQNIPIRSRYVIGSNHGWIVTADNRSELQLLNPITGDQIALPSVATIEQVKPVYDDYGALHKYELSRYTALEVYETPRVFDLGELRDYLYLKAFLSSDPSTGNYYVVLFHDPYMQLSFARVRDDKWTWLPPHTFCYDCITEDDMFYVATQDGAIHAFDISGPTITQRIILDEVKDISEKIYIALAPCGDLLQIWKDINDPDYIDDVSELEIDAEFYARCSTTCKVHKVDLAAKKLVEISSLGDNLLFLGHNPSLCLCAGEYPQLKSNHVYFTDDSDYLPFGRSQHRYIRIHNLENSCSEEIVSPQLWANWPAPVWVIPNPRKMNPASLLVRQVYRVLYFRFERPDYL